jgi:hypothetical protein
VGKRSSRAHRRPSIRRPIPGPRTSPPRAGAARSMPLMPVYDTSTLLGMLVNLPADAVPLYAVLAVVHGLMSGRPAGSCVTMCHQIAGALGHLGFAAEPMAPVPPCSAATSRYTDVGVWEQPPPQCVVIRRCTARWPWAGLDSRVPVGSCGDVEALRGAIRGAKRGQTRWPWSPTVGEWGNVYARSCHGYRRKRLS